MQTIIGAFDDRATAQRAVEERKCSPCPVATGSGIS